MPTLTRWLRFVLAWTTMPISTGLCAVSLAAIALMCSNLLRKIWAQNPCAHCRLLHILCASYQPQCHLLLWCHCSWLKLCREWPRFSLGSRPWVWTSWLECARCISWQPHAPWWKVLAHQSRFFRQATAHALFQSPEQWWPYSCGAIGWRGTRKKWLSQKQVHREESRIRGGLVGASHRWHRCFWYAVYWVWKVPTAWFLWGICGRSEIVWQFYVNVCINNRELIKFIVLLRRSKY